MPDKEKTEKKCSRCDCVKSVSEFHVDKSKSDGHCSTCKLCACNRTRNWTKDNPERSAENTKNWVRSHPEERKKIANRYFRNSYQTKGREYRDKARERHYNARFLFLRQLGARCSCCGFDSRPDILQFDHIIPVRRNSKNRVGGFVNWACSNGLKSPIVWDELHTNIQILCPNCHATKTLDEPRRSVDA